MKYVFVFLLFIIGSCHAEEEKFIAPGPTYTFGQNILKQGTMVAIESFNYLETDAGSFFDNTHLFIVAFTDNSSLTTFVPVILRDRIRGLKKESGLGSITFEYSYALINRDEENFYQLMTLSGAVAFPSSTTTDIPTVRSVPATSFFVGWSNSMLGNGWYWYSSIGTIIHTKKRQRKLRNRFIFDLGIGKVVQKSDNHYYALLIEMNEIYLGSPSVAEGIEINRKPINIFLIGPTIRFATSKNIVQFSFQYPFTQRNATDFERVMFRTTLAAAWRF